MKKINRYFCLFLLLALYFGPTIRAQTAGGVAREKIYRLLGKQLGSIRTLKVSQAVVESDPDIKRSFEATKLEIERYNRTIERIQRKGAHSIVEWGEYIDAFKRVTAARGGFQDKLQYEIATIRPKLKVLVGNGVIQQQVIDLDHRLHQKSVEMAVINEIFSKIESGAQDYTNLQIQWPTNFDILWRQNVEEALLRASEGSKPQEAVKILRQRMTRIREDLAESTSILRDTIDASRGQLSEIEEEALLKLAVLSEMQMDLASNAIAQQTTLERRLIAESVFQAWQGLQKAAGSN